MANKKLNPKNVSLVIRANIPDHLATETITPWVSIYGRQTKTKVEVSWAKEQDTYVYTIRCEGTVSSIREYKALIASLIAGRSIFFSMLENKL